MATNFASQGELPQQHKRYSYILVHPAIALKPLSDVKAVGETKLHYPPNPPSLSVSSPKQYSHSLKSLCDNLPCKKSY